MTENMITTTAKPENTAAEPATGLRGNIGTFELVMSVVALSAPLVTIAGMGPVMGSFGGNSAPVIYIMCMAILICFSGGFVKMSMYIKNPGGFYAFITQGLGKKIGLGAAFLSGIGYPLIGFFGPCYFPMFLSSYIHDILQGPAIPWWTISFLYIAVIVYMDCHKIDISAKVLSYVMLAECVVVTMFDVGSFLMIGDAPGGAALSLPDMGVGSTFGVAMLLIFGTFLGFEATVIYREEVKTPEKTIPRATMISVLLIGIFYAIGMWAYVAFYGADGIVAAATTDGEHLFQNAMLVLFGRVMLHIVTVMVMFSMFASTLSAVNVSARYLYSMGKDGVLPTAFGKVHPVYASPYRGVIAIGTVYAIAVSVLAFLDKDPGQIFAIASGVGSFCILLVMFITSLSVLTYFVKHLPAEADTWSTKVSPVLGVLGTGLITYWGMRNYGDLVGNEAIAGILLAITFGVFVFGIIYAAWLQRHRMDIYLKIGRQMF